MGKLYILSNSFEPTSANTNHELCFIRAFSELGIKATWVFLLPSAKFDTITTEFSGIQIKYLWSKLLSKFRITRHLFKIFSFNHFLLSLKKGDTVLLLGLPGYLENLIKIKGINVYHERTEHPEVVKFSKKKSSLSRYLDSCKKVKGLFVITQALKNYFISVGINEFKIHVINMVVDESRFENLKKQSSDKYIAYCGKASNNKDGVDRLIRAFSIVKQEIPNVKLYIIGTPPDLLSDNSNLVRQLNLEKDIVFTGQLEPNKIPQILKNASALALARPDNLQNKYGFPTKLGEYLLTSNPVVITKVGDIPLFLKDGVSAYLSECDDIEAFASNLIKAVTDKNDAIRIGKNGKIIAQQNFNYLIETKKIIEVIGKHI